MKKLFMLLAVAIGTLTAQAENDDYPYLTFETADGAKISISTASLTINIQDGKLMAGSMELTLADLSKMYFSTSDETTGIKEVNTTTLDESADIYDLLGRKVTKDQMRRGIYVVKTKSGIRKVRVK
jgi:hypothetical protein